MNRFGGVKEEYAGASSSHIVMASTPAPQPMEGLHDSGPPPFLTKTYEIVEDLSTNHIVSWSRGNNSFVVWDPQTFSTTLLPRYFKHNNFSSFVRQLNTYGFRKVDPDRWEFANEGFLRGQKHLLKNIRRRKTPQLLQSSHHQQSLDPSCVELGRFGIDGEIDRLRRDKQVLMMELIKLRQQQQTTKSCLQLMENRLKRTETRQQHMMNFLARAMQNPNFMQQLVQQKHKRKELEDAISKKRRRQIDQGPSNLQIGNYDNIIGSVEGFVKNEPEEFGDLSELEVPEFDSIALNIQGVSRSGGALQNLEEAYIGKLGDGGNYIGKSTKEQLDDRFWDDLLNEDNIGEEIGMFDDGVEDMEDVDMLVEQLGYLGSSPK